MIILVMGVTGAGKTTVGKLLAERLHWNFLDADDFHPPANIEKMKRGFSLTDADREPWLAAIHAALLECAAKKQDAILACSALKQTYREKLARGIDLRICYLKGSFEEISRRLEHRTGHFAGEGILAAQFADLEEPKEAVVLSAAATPEENVREALSKLNLSAASKY